MTIQLAIQRELFRRQVQEDILFKDFDKYGYFLIEGGRSGGKTQRIARLLALRAEKEKYRLFCGREIQNTIEDSVYTVFKNIILEYGLNFDITKTTITHRDTKAQFKFKGFREQGKYNIQGLEDIDVLWIDEAQAIAKATLDIIVPTIRKEHSKIFFSMNRFLEDDPVFDKFNRTNDRKDTLHLTINYTDNKFLSQKMIYEAEECKKKNYSDYLHIWMGEPQKESDVECALNLKDLRLAVNRDIKVEGGIVVGIDVARFGDDRTTMYKRQGLKTIAYRVYTKKDIIGDFSKASTDSTGTVKLADFAEEFVEFDKSVLFNVDDTGLGGGLTDQLRKRGYKANAINNNGSPTEKNKNIYDDSITEMFFEFNKIINEVSIPDDPELIAELSSRKYMYTKKQIKKMEPKKDFKKRFKKSPDKGDGFLLCFYNRDPSVHLMVL